MDEIVQHQVNAALEDERKEMTRLKNDNETLKLRVEQLDHDKKGLETNKKQLIEQITSLREDLAFYSRNKDVQESIMRID